MKSVALAALGLAGCATVFAGGPDEIPINTNPPGAYVYLNGQVIGQTPTIVRLDRHADSADIRIYYPGFQPVQLARYKSFNMWTIGNFFIGMIPIVVDFVTGDWQRYDDDPISVGLTPGGGPPPYGMQPTLGAQPGYPQQAPQGYPQAPAPYPQQQAPQGYPQAPAPYPQAPAPYPQQPAPR